MILYKNIILSSYNIFLKKEISEHKWWKFEKVYNHFLDKLENNQDLKQSIEYAFKWEFFSSGFNEITRKDLVYWRFVIENFPILDYTWYLIDDNIFTLNKNKGIFTPWIWEIWNTINYSKFTQEAQIRAYNEFLQLYKNIFSNFLTILIKQIDEK